MCVCGKVCSDCGLLGSLVFHVCMCLRKRERERDMGREREIERERETERQTVCMYVSIYHIMFF